MNNFVLGRLVALNLTAGRGSVQKQCSDLDLVRAIRHGIGVNGKSLRVIPSRDFY